MKVFVAMVGEFDGTAVSVGVYESVDLAMAGLRLYADYNESVFSMNDYYEVYEYELGHVLKVRSSDQEALRYGKIEELLAEVYA